MIGPIVDLLTFLGGREQMSMVLVPWELMLLLFIYYIIVLLFIYLFILGKKVYLQQNIKITQFSKSKTFNI